MNRTPVSYVHSSPRSVVVVTVIVMGFNGPRKSNIHLHLVCLLLFFAPFAHPFLVVLSTPPDRTKTSAPERRRSGERDRSCSQHRRDS